MDPPEISPAFAQACRKIEIQLDQPQFAADDQQWLGEGAQSGTDLDDTVFARHGSQRDDAARRFWIGEKMLPEPFTRTATEIIEDAAYRSRGVS